MKDLVTVLMSVYNEEVNILDLAIESVLKQTYKNFRFLIIIDNANNFNAIETVREYMESDERIQLFINESNLGLAGALNRGIEKIDTKYIARMDADDIAISNRLEKQIEFLESNSDVGVVGCNVIYINLNGETIANRGAIPTAYHDIRFIMKYKNIMNHPTFVGKTEIFKKYQYRDLQYSQDYDLICRLLEDGIIIRNLPDYLLRYRVNPNVSEDKKTKQKITMHVIRKEYRKRSLQKSDIIKEVKNKLKNINKNKMLISMNRYDLSLEKFKDGYKIQALFILLQACMCSKIMMSEFFNTFVYFLYKKKWR